jgi:peroxiredoxin
VPLLARGVATKRTRSGPDLFPSSRYVTRKRSGDGIWCHAAFAKARNLHFPLLADFEPKGAVARAYGAYRASDGVTERALFVLDRSSIIRWSHLSPIDVNPGADGILEALEAMRQPT